MAARGSAPGRTYASDRQRDHPTRRALLVLVVVIGLLGAGIGILWEGPPTDPPAAGSPTPTTTDDGPADPVTTQPTAGTDQATTQPTAGTDPTPTSPVDEGTETSGMTATPTPTTVGAGGGDGSGGDGDDGSGGDGDDSSGGDGAGEATPTPGPQSGVEGESNPDAR